MITKRLIQQIGHIGIPADKWAIFIACFISIVKLSTIPYVSWHFPRTYLPLNVQENNKITVVKINNSNLWNLQWTRYTKRNKLVSNYTWRKKKLFCLLFWVVINTLYFVTILHLFKKLMTNELHSINGRKIKSREKKWITIVGQIQVNNFS